MSDPWDEWSLRRLLSLIGRSSMQESLIIQGTPDDLKIYLNCSDQFYWATADAEDVTPDDLDLFESCIDDLKKIETLRYDRIYSDALYASRKRGMRPQGPWYGYERRAYVNADVAALFDACGPEREDSPKIPQKAVVNDD